MEPKVGQFQVLKACSQKRDLKKIHRSGSLMDLDPLCIRKDLETKMVPKPKHSMGLSYICLH